ncbi:MAG: methyltransferase [Rhodospirillaceae bacterium]|nr:methyltransferase [Rhodospirillaceae bacterium]
MNTALSVARDVTDDALLNGRVRLRQPKTGYRAAIDPVLLAAAVRASGSARVLDAGCGTGAATFCLAARLPLVDVSGLERQPELAALAQEGVALNNLSARARIVQGDLMALPDLICAYPFDIVMTNPPYADGGTVSPDAQVAAAHHESDADLGQWIAACVGLLKPKGRLVLIHRADRLSEILSCLKLRCGDIRITPLFPKPGEPARRVIVDAGLDRKTGDTLHPGLVLHGPDGAFTPKAQAILRDGLPLAA